MAARLIPFVLAAALSAGAAQAGEREDVAAVLAAMDQVLSAQNRGDAATYAPLELSDGMTYSQAYAPDGKPTLRRRPNSYFLARLKPDEPTLERYWRPTVRVRRDIAFVWTPYAFDVASKRSHCGYDLFEFVRVAGQWKIANAMWTVEPDACPALERGVREAEKRPRPTPAK